MQKESQVPLLWFSWGLGWADQEPPGLQAGWWLGLRVRLEEGELTVTQHPLCARDQPQAPTTEAVHSFR